MFAADLHLLDPRDRDRRRRTEAEANKFAAHLLMPPARVRASLRQGTSSLEHLCAMAREFGVSKEAMARAWAEHHREPVAIMVAHHGRVLRHYRSEDFPWLPDRHGRATPQESAAAANLIQGEFSPVEEVEPDVWLSERDARRVLCLTEQILGQRDGYALILLQAELDEDEDDAH